MLATILAWLMIGCAAFWVASLFVRRSGRAPCREVELHSASRRHGVSHVEETPQRHTDQLPAAPHNQRGSLRRIERADLLRRFSEAEIQRLSELQVRFRDRPTALDAPLDLSAGECRLRFARWLVEHGRLNEEDEDDDADREEPQEQETSSDSGRQGRSSKPPRDVPDGDPDGERAPESTRRKHLEAWRLARRNEWWRIRQEWAGSTESRCALESRGYLPNGVGVWGPPYSALSLEAQCMWLRLCMGW
jgi:hypothetical protein